jgi:hypothetical protein
MLRQTWIVIILLFASCITGMTGPSYHTQVLLAEMEFLELFSPLHPAVSAWAPASLSQTLFSPFTPFSQFSLPLPYLRASSLPRL